MSVREDEPLDGIGGSETTKLSRRCCWGLRGAAHSRRGSAVRSELQASVGRQRSMYLACTLAPSIAPLVNLQGVRKFSAPIHSFSDLPTGGRPESSQYARRRWPRLKRNSTLKAVRFSDLKGETSSIDKSKAPFTHTNIATVPGRLAGEPELWTYLVSF